jgi:hypothetical protein
MNRTWEYASFEVSPGGDIGWVSEIDIREANASFLAARREGLTAVLRFMGRHGWEMTSAIPLRGRSHHSNSEARGLRTRLGVLIIPAHANRFPHDLDERLPSLLVFLNLTPTLLQLIRNTELLSWSNIQHVSPRKETHVHGPR